MHNIDTIQAQIKNKFEIKNNITSYKKIIYVLKLIVKVFSINKKSF